jgi:hypothetical protein
VVAASVIPPDVLYAPVVAASVNRPDVLYPPVVVVVIVVISKGIDGHVRTESVITVANETPED